jgi:23S rRNA (uracil1939-C5)-methyltransferase
VSEPITVRVHALAAGGDGVGRDDDGRAVFVAATAPGDVVTARVVERHARWARAELVEVVEAGAGRVAPPCPLFAARRCGGCQWQHVDDATQRAGKQALLAGALRRLIGAGMELRPLVTPVAPWGWRRRARWAAAGGALGFHAPRGRAVCDVEACPQLEPALEAALGAIRGGAVLRGDGEVAAITGDGGVHVVIDAPCEAEAAAALVGQGGIAGVAWRDGAAGAAVVVLEPGQVARGDDFAQASRAGNAALRALVAEATAVRTGERVLELYAGGGNFTRDLVAAGAEVVASDGRAPAQAAAGFVVGEAAAVVRELAARGERFDVVLLDPPRTGARDVVGAVAALAPARVIYVSCDPATFARDAEVLSGSGIRPRWAQGLDLMPQTAHVELVAAFARQ